MLVTMTRIQGANFPSRNVASRGIRCRCPHGSAPTTFVPLLLLFGGLGVYTYIGLFLHISHDVAQIPDLRVPALPVGVKSLFREDAVKSQADWPFRSIATSFLTNSTVASNSIFYIKDLKSSYKMCDVLELYIEVRDGKNVRKKMGGDHMWAFIRTSELKASAPADQLIDHGDGSYTARFTLTWAGLVEPVVRFVNSAEHVAVLRNIRERVPYRFAYEGKFAANGITEVTPCHVSKVIPYIASKGDTHFSYASESETCDFSDIRAGTQWYCLKPKTLPCTAIAQFIGNASRGAEYLNKVTTPEEKRVTESYGPSLLWNIGLMKSVEVVSPALEKETDSCLRLPECTPGLPPKPATLAAGYYYKDSWRSKVCRERTLRLPEILKCLQGKNLYFYGDSTLRQWFEYLVTHLGPTMTERGVLSKSQQRFGPRYGTDTVNNITLFYRHHEFPIRNTWIDAADIRFTANEIDALPGGPNTVVSFTYCAHFTATNLTYYRSRLEIVKAAVKRLHRRGSSPSPVFFKSANTMDMLRGDLNDFNAYELDRVMRGLFTEVPNVTIIDAWDMTLSHRTGYRAHPTEAVIREEIKMFLNFLCTENAL